MDKRQAEEKLKEFDKVLDKEREEVANSRGPRVATPFGMISYSMAKFFAKHNIGVLQGLIWAFIIFAIFMALVLINNFYLKIVF